MIARENRDERVFVHLFNAEDTEQDRRGSALVRGLHDSLRLRPIEFAKIELPMGLRERDENLIGGNIALRPTYRVGQQCMPVEEWAELLRATVAADEFSEVPETSAIPACQDHAPA